MFSGEIRKVSLPSLRKVMKPEEFSDLEERLNQNWSGFWTVNEIFTKMDGFKNLDEFYEEASLEGKMNQIKVPTFALNSENDFISDPKVLPKKEIEQSGNVMMGLSKRGSHCCYISGLVFPKAWYPEPFLEWFEFHEKTLKNNEPYAETASSERTTR